MTPEQLNVRIAEWMGWRVQFNESKQLFELLTPQGKWEHPYDADGSESHCWSYAPAFTECSNAMREALGRLGDEGWRRYLPQLAIECKCCTTDIIPSLEVFKSTFLATPLQQATALVRAIDGKADDHA